MIKAADLPAVRARAENDPASTAPGDAAALAASVPAAYPSKKLVLENGRYVVAEPTK